MKYLVTASEGPGFDDPESIAEILESTILPMFENLVKLDASGKILAGGVPLGQRGFVFVLEADSNSEVDQLLRNLPAWGALEWDVIALQEFSGRMEHERKVVATLKSR